MDCLAVQRGERKRGAKEDSGNSCCVRGGDWELEA